MPGTSPPPPAGTGDGATPRTVAVLGPIPFDRVVTHHGDVYEKYGCALYTAAALSALLSPDDRICPVVHVRRRDEEAIKEALSPFANIDVSGISSRTDRGDVVELRYVDQNTRLERQTGFMSPIVPDDVEPFLDADAFVCVPITDYQVSLDTLKFIRARSRGTVLLDGHGPTVALARGGERVHRLWADRDSWLGSIDILKMNLEEAGCSWFPSADAPGGTTAGAELSVADLPAFAEHCLRRGLQALCVTLDEHGCAVYSLDDEGSLVESVVDRMPVEQVVDTTGCGDSFAAGMAFGYLRSGDVVEAARFGNAMGAQRCAGSELAVYLPFLETERQIQLAYA